MRLIKTLISATSIAICLAFTAAPAFAAEYKVIRYFNSGVGQSPGAGLIFDASGNLYSTTVEGGAGGSGTVFELSPGAGGKWVETVLYSFCAQSNCADGANPYSGLVFDSAGNLYGTTTAGGKDNNGVVFQLAPGSNGSWTEHVLYRFCSVAACDDGATPWATLTFDSSGSLYGTTFSGGSIDRGVAFKLSRARDGDWHETVLHNFGVGKDGYNPISGLVFDSAGNLYGTTPHGGDVSRPNCGSLGCGTVFELSPKSTHYTEHVIYSFKGLAGSGPIAGLILDASGNLYGTASTGGAHGDGAVFELSPGAAGWTETTLHSFDGSWKDPTGSLILDGSGNLYGTCQGGGVYNLGIVFELSPEQDGLWAETVLHSFNNSGGTYPSANLIFDGNGNLYGTAYEGGSACAGAGCGTVFEITP
ncbi:MAG TPA: choice-of-anchor tandem repeat GloVer-containing protein [Terriglobales bacterium]